jgi:hypothetical protein
MIELLTRPFYYLKISHQFKRRADWALPGLLSLITVVLLWLFSFGSPVGVWNSGGLVEKILGFVQGLPGFYIAALAAIATFNKLDIDKKMPAPAPKMHIQVRGVDQYIELTRRRFLCLMFAFLTAESILLIVLSIFGAALHEPIKALLPTYWIYPVSLAAITIYFFVFWQMIVVTLWGLYYLGDRLHQVDV